MVVVVDYKAGNIRSVANALARLGVEACLTNEHQLIRSADRVILPGVGHAGQAMSDLHQGGLDALIGSLTQPVLGICVGMQLMCRASQEGDTRGLGIFDCLVNKIEASDRLKVPHIGWNTIYNTSGALLGGFDKEVYVYYVHSYAAGICRHTIATTDYGGAFSGALGVDNFYGTQFHPEKSGSVGERILRNFLDL